MKVFKLLINELHHMKEENSLDSEYNTDDEDEEGGEEGNIDDSGDSFGENERTLNASNLWFDDDEDEDNQMLQDLLPDPVFVNNLEENLTKFLQNFARAEQFVEYANHLNENEKLILRSIEIGV